MKSSENNKSGTKGHLKDAKISRDGTRRSKRNPKPASRKTNKYSKD